VIYKTNNLKNKIMSREIVPGFSSIIAHATLNVLGKFVPVWKDFLKTDYPLTITVKLATWDEATQRATILPGDPIITIPNVLEGDIIIVDEVPVGCNWLDIFSVADPTIRTGGAARVGMKLPDGTVDFSPRVYHYPAQ
jgi:hypothetical protein